MNMSDIDKNAIAGNDQMSFNDHLEELRHRILNSIYSVLISIFISCNIVSKDRKVFLKNILFSSCNAIMGFLKMDSPEGATGLNKHFLIKSDS